MKPSLDSLPRSTTHSLQKVIVNIPTIRLQCVRETRQSSNCNRNAFKKHKSHITNNKRPCNTLPKCSALLRYSLSLLSATIGYIFRFSNHVIISQSPAPRVRRDMDNLSNHEFTLGERYRPDWACTSWSRLSRYCSTTHRFRPIVLPSRKVKGPVRPRSCSCAWIRPQYQ